MEHQTDESNDLLRHRGDLSLNSVSKPPCHPSHANMVWNRRHQRTRSPHLTTFQKMSTRLFKTERFRMNRSRRDWTRYNSFVSHQSCTIDHLIPQQQILNLPLTGPKPSMRKSEGSLLTSYSRSTFNEETAQALLCFWVTSSVFLEPPALQPEVGV